MASNCWNILNCGREEGGKNIHSLGICPASVHHEYNGINSGTNAGRICWLVSGTFCHDEIQGSFAQKKLTCISCPVYKQVKQEEGENFILKN